MQDGADSLTQLASALLVAVFIGSISIGVFGGAAIALLFKLVQLRLLPPNVAAPAELICLVCLSYTTFLAAEYAHLSGIVASLFSGAVCVMYVKRNLSAEGAALCDTTVRMLAKFAETIVFVVIGFGFWLYTVGGGSGVSLDPSTNSSAATGTETGAAAAAAESASYDDRCWPPEGPGRQSALPACDAVAACGVPMQHCRLPLPLARALARDCAYSLTRYQSRCMPEHRPGARAQKPDHATGSRHHTTPRTMQRATHCIATRIAHRATQVTARQIAPTSHWSASHGANQLNVLAWACRHRATLRPPRDTVPRSALHVTPCHAPPST